MARDVPVGSDRRGPVLGSGRSEGGRAGRTPILLTVWMVDGGTEMAVTAYSVTPDGPLIAPVGNCNGQGVTPTPSSSTVRPAVDPSLSADTERIVSPFQCEFAFPAAESADDRLSVVARVASADQIRAEFERRFGNQPPTTEVGDADGVWATTTGMPPTAGGVIAETSGYDPRDPSAGGRHVLSAGPGAYRLVSEAVSFVGVRDGVVVATVTPSDDGATPGVVLDRVSQEDEVDAFLLDRSALTACDTRVDDLDALDLYVIAGYNDQGVTYAWSEVPQP